MKKSLFYLFIMSLCLIGFTACEDDDDLGIKFYTSSERVTSVTINTVGNMFVEVTNANGRFTVKSNDESIVTATINQHTLINLKGVKEGKTSITVTDGENKSATLLVEVTTKVEYISMSKHSVFVEATNPTAEDLIAIEKIKKEIDAKLLPEGSGFKLTYVSDAEGTLVYYPDLKNTAEKFDGTFKMERDEVLKALSIKVYYNSTEYMYYIGTENDMQTRTSIAIPIYWITDYTKDYLQLSNPKITKARGGVLVSTNSDKFK